MRRLAASLVLVAICAPAQAELPGWSNAHVAGAEADRQLLANSRECNALARNQVAATPRRFEDGVYISTAQAASEGPYRSYLQATQSGPGRDIEIGAAARRRAADLCLVQRGWSFPGAPSAAG